MPQSDDLPRRWGDEQTEQDSSEAALTWDRRVSLSLQEEKDKKALSGVPHPFLCLWLNCDFCTDNREETAAEMPNACFNPESHKTD